MIAKAMQCGIVDVKVRELLLTIGLAVTSSLSVSHPFLAEWSIVTNYTNLRNLLPELIITISTRRNRNSIFRMESRTKWKSDA